MFGKKIILRKIDIQFIIDYPLKNFCYHENYWNGTIAEWIIALTQMFVERGDSSIFTIVRKYTCFKWLIKYQYSKGLLFFECELDTRYQKYSVSQVSNFWLYNCLQIPGNDSEIPKSTYEHVRKKVYNCVSGEKEFFREDGLKSMLQVFRATSHQNQAKRQLYEAVMMKPDLKGRDCICLKSKSYKRLYNSEKANRIRIFFKVIYILKIG